MRNCGSGDLCWCVLDFLEELVWWGRGFGLVGVVSVLVGLLVGLLMEVGIVLNVSLLEVVIVLEDLLAMGVVVAGGLVGRLGVLVGCVSVSASSCSNIGSSSGLGSLSNMGSSMLSVLCTVLVSCELSDGLSVSFPLDSESVKSCLA